MDWIHTVAEYIPIKSADDVETLRRCVSGIKAAKAVEQRYRVGGVMPETKGREPIQEEVDYQKLLEKYTEDHFRYIHGRINYDQLQDSHNRMEVAYDNMLEAHKLVRQEGSGG